eukprot:scaffold30350_cov105-Isochrysis_galbana.AAC.1
MRRSGPDTSRPPPQQRCGPPRRSRAASRRRHPRSVRRRHPRKESWGHRRWPRDPSPGPVRGCWKVRWAAAHAARGPGSARVKPAGRGSLWSRPAPRQPAIRLPVHRWNCLALGDPNLAARLRVQSPRAAPHLSPDCNPPRRAEARRRLQPLPRRPRPWKCQVRDCARARRTSRTG